MSAETDVAVAFVAKWNATPALGSAVPGGLYADQVSQAQARPSEAPRPVPYAILTVTQARPPRFGHRFWTDYRTVTLEVYGHNGKVDLGQLVSLAHATFDFPAKLPIAGPDGWHAWTELGLDDDEAPSPQKRHGQYARVARIRWTVATERIRG